MLLGGGLRSPSAFLVNICIYPLINFFIHVFFIYLFIQYFDQPFIKMFFCCLYMQKWLEHQELIYGLF